jgi:hypothetical protein
MVQTRERDRAINLAKSSTESAIQAARLISDPFSRCQALAWAARYAASDTTAAKIAEEAARAAEDAPDAYESVAAAAWPVRALVERARPRDAERITGQAIKKAQQIANPVSRVDALFLLVQAGWSTAGAGWSAAVASLVAAAQAAPRQKPQAVLRDLVLMLAGADRDFNAVIAAIAEGKYKRQTEGRLARREFMTPRPFFW